MTYSGAEDKWEILNSVWPIRGPSDCGNNPFYQLNGKKPSEMCELGILAGCYLSETRPGNYGYFYKNIPSAASC